MLTIKLGHYDTYKDFTFNNFTYNINTMQHYLEKTLRLTDFTYK
jgi:hypothetical protein